MNFLKENTNREQDYNTEKENMNFENKKDMWNVIGYKIKIEHLCTIYD